MKGITYLAQWIPRLTGLGGAAMTVYGLINIVRIIYCEDEGLVGQYKARVKNGVIGAVVLATLTAILAFVGANFFGISIGSLIFVD